MNWLAFRVVLYFCSIIEASSDLEEISSSFQGNNFSDIDNWVVTGAQPKFTNCGGKILFGGYGEFAIGVSVSKVFELPPHAQINLKAQFWRIDSWSNEYGYIFVDYQMAWHQKLENYNGIQICGGYWKDQFLNLDLNIKHSGPTAVVVFTSNLDELPNNESWGFRDFVLSVERCPTGCLVCQLNDELLTCQVWKIMYQSWKWINEIQDDGWNVISGIPDPTQCGGKIKKYSKAVALFGGYSKTGRKTVISKLFIKIPPHYKLKIQFLFAKIDSWDKEVAQLRLDDVIIWERAFQANEGYPQKICGSQSSSQKTAFVRVDQDIDHSQKQVNINFQATLNENFENESFGLRDFVLFYAACVDNCDECTGGSGSECLSCSQGSYYTGVYDKICKQCYQSCYQCDGPSIDNCIDCGDIDIYHKQLVAGKCICDIRTIEFKQNEGSTLCLPCHPKCEKCYQPFDNTSNQYCTMCISGQNRVVSENLNCVCKAGYGEDALSEVCVQCHYTCENCKGSLGTDCTSCSPLSNRHLTSDNQCLCNKNYIDSGTNDMNCLYACHHSCSDCDIDAEDKCTSCPSTREPDRIGITFKCICKDPHYFSDDIQLECLQCHSTCKTCNGIQDNNCLTCDLAFRQLVMFKCICPYGYYDVGSLECSPCYYTCMTCFGPNEDNCITCSWSNHREIKSNKCSCIDTYVDKQMGDPMCYKCSYRCANCSGTTDNCTSCPSLSYRELGTDNSCSCPAKLYDQPENPFCIICHHTCLKCIGTKENQCISCNVHTMRQLDSTGKCLCMNKYYDAGQTECQACSNYCLSCAISAQNCISCREDRYLQGNSCVCQTKLNGASISSYQVQGKIECESINQCYLDCHYSCLSCNGSSAKKCISCLDTEKRILQNTSCVCDSHYYDNGKPKCLCINFSQIVQECSYRCETCVGIDTICLTCYENSFRNLIDQQCICQKGYYDDGSSSICQKCHYSCSECSSISTKCEACSLISNRRFITSLFTCNCLDSYYDSGVEICQLCHYSCLTCSAFGSQQCKSCQDKLISFRVFNSGICQCLSGYYDDGVSTNCKACQIQCLTCQNEAYFCTSCRLTKHLEGNNCQCDTGYFDNNEEKCIKCDPNCLNCIVNYKNCTECDSSLQRILDKASRTCICKPGTTEINGICQQCDRNCLTCQNSISNCTSCQTLRVLLNNKCQCIDGTFENENEKKCQFCNQKCFTCINEENNCTSCSANNNRIIKTGNECICQDGYYEETITQKCKQCDLSCLTCKISATYCLSCDSKQNLNLDIQNRCICSNGFYFNSSTLKCEACNQSCKECKSVSQCLECDLLTRYYDPENFKCPCKDGYYESNAKQCSLCDITCKTCINKSNKCLSCEAIYYRILNNLNNCQCQDGYYDIGVEMCQLCNKLCKTCIINSTTCLSCYDLQHFRQLNVNLCICQNGYYDNGSLICEKCSNECLTCQGQRNYCTSCDINQKRIDQSAVNKCPCQSGFYQDINENCQKCNLKCQTCYQSKENCISCSTSLNTNRHSISKNCICKDGYYDDGNQAECQKCNQRCKVCSDSSTNCQKCSSNLRDQPPNCNCAIGYFENSNQNCDPCDNQCLTCENISSNCLLCKEGRSTKQCLCQDGYFEGGQPLCVQCEFQCLTCKDSSKNCLKCKGDRINIPICTCPQGFYDDLVNEQCKGCDELCQACNLDGCLICNGNRILSSEMSCDQPPDSIAHPDTPWCSTCEVAVLKIRFSDDLLSIYIEFDFPLNPKFFTSQFSENICLKILDENTFQLLGQNPICNIDPNDDTRLILEIGQRVTIITGDKILLKSDSFGHLNCESNLRIFIFTQVKNPINPVSPLIIYEIPTYYLNPCDDNTIPIKQKMNDGLRGFKGVKWTFTVEGLNGHGNLDNFVAQQTSLQVLELNIPFKTLPKQSNITLIIEFQNFVGQKTTQIIKLSTHSGQFPTILWNLKLQYFTFETIVVGFQIKKKDCSESANTQVDKVEYQASIIEVYRNDSNSRPSRVSHSENTRQDFFNVTINNYTLSPRTAYTFQQTTIDALRNFSITSNITIEITPGGIICQFNGTKPIQNYRKETILQISCKDLDTQFDWNEDSGISIDVQCIDLTKNTYCVDLNNKIIKINHTQYIQILPKLSVKPFSIQSWQVVASKKKYSNSIKQTIVFLDNDFNLLNVSYNQYYSIRPVNNYENLKFAINIPFEDRKHLLNYQIAIIYNFNLISILQSEYFTYQFRMFDYFQEFNKGKRINLKFLAQFTNEIVPSQYDLQVVVNQPPNCVVSLSQQSIEALQPLKIITICDFSETAPYSYQMRYFIQNQDYLEFSNRTSDYSLILNYFQSSNVFEEIFPFADSILLIQALDSKGSYQNIVEKLIIIKTLLNCSDINITNYKLKQQISLLFEITLNNQDQDSCILLQQQVYSNLKTNQETDDINDQLLIHQTIKLYMRLIQNQVKINSQKRLLDDGSLNNCFENSTKLFYFQNSTLINSTLNNSKTVTSKTLQVELKQLKAVAKGLILQYANLDEQISQHQLFLDEKLFQKKEAVLNSLSVLLLLIDETFNKIPNVSIFSDSDQEYIIKLCEELLNLIQSISKIVSNLAKVNGQQLIIDGKMMKWQLSKTTKDHFNIQFNISKDILDGLIDFVQIEEIDINYNHLNLSQQILTQLQLFFKITNLEIDNRILKKTILRNHLYNNNYNDYQLAHKKYLIDMLNYQYCRVKAPQQSLYYYQCVGIDVSGQLYKCDLINEEIDNKTVLISCFCQQLGSTFLIKYQNNIFTQQNNSLIATNEDEGVGISELKLSESPILLFHAIFVCFSCFLYFQLFSLEQKAKEDKIDTRLDTERSEDESIKSRQVKLLEIYPGNFILFKKSFKYIHEILSLFYMDHPALTRSYRFLQFSIKISLFIPIAFSETIQLNQITAFSILLINCCSFLLIRMILKLIQSIYRFGGKWTVSIIIIFLLLHFISYLEFIFQLKQYHGDHNQINFEISLVLVASIFSFYILVDPIMIFSRILILRHIKSEIRNSPNNPKYFFLYFFVQHKKLDDLFKPFVIM